MAAIWILLGKTRFPAELIESSKEHGVRTASVPFDISADFIPDLLRELPQFGRSKSLSFQELETFSQQTRFDGDRSQPAKHSIYLAPEEKPWRLRSL
jgi:hypothetical protein